MIAVGFLCFLWLAAPMTIALLGGSVFWVIASGVIGGLLVFGCMGLITVLDGYGPPTMTPEERDIEDSLNEIRHLKERIDAAYRQHDHKQADHLTTELDKLTGQLRARLDSALKREVP